LRSGLADATSGRGRLGGVFLISGEPGIGKTRLADELAADAASRGMRVVWGRCWEGGGAPAYLPWVDVLRSLIIHVPRERERHSALPAEIAQLIPELSSETTMPRVPADPAQARFRLFDAIATLLKQVASSAPLLIVLDDLHEADQGSLELLKFVARGLTDSRIVIIGTHRDAEVRRSPHLSETIGEIQRHGHAIPLGGLDQNEVTRMVEDRAQRSPSAAFASELYRVTAGNPLFVDGVVRVLLAERTLGTSDRIDLRGFKLPEDVRGAIRKRLGLLSPQAQSVLAIAAVVGQEFDIALVRRISDLSAGASGELMDEAYEVGVVTLSSHDSYRFTHPLIRESLYKGSTEEERTRLHRAIGEALEQMHAANLTPYLAALAHHFDHAAAASPDPLQIEKAIEYSLRAGWAAMHVEAWEEALVHFHAGLRHAEKGQDSQRRQAEFLAGIAFTRAWSDQTSKDASAEIESAIKLCEERGLLGQAVRLRTQAALGFCKDDEEDLTDISRAMRHFEAAQRQLEHATDHDSLWFYITMALAGWKSLDTVRGMEVSQQGLKMSARLRAPDFIVHFSIVRAQLLAHTGRIAEALATPIDRNSAEALPRQLEMTGRILSRLWDPAHGKPWLLEGVGLPASFFKQTAGFDPNTDFRALAETLAVMHVMTGNLEDAQALVDKAPSTLLRGIIAIHGGDWTTAKSVLETGLSITRASGARERHADLSFWYARLLRITGQTAHARAFLDDALQIFGEGSLPLVELWLRPECILALEGKDAAQSHLVRCREILASHEDWRGLVGAVARAEAVVAAADNRIQDAETFFERAIATFTRYALPWEQAETLHYWGKTLTLAGEHSRATEKFDAAIETYRRHGAGQHWVDRVEADKDAAVPRSLASSDNTTFPPIFRKEGEYWKTAYEGGSANVRERGGMRFIALLLARPGEDIPAIEMFATHSAGAGISPAQDGLRAASDLGDAGEEFDARALSEYRRRITEVESEIEAAETSHDSGAVARARAEREMLSQEIASGTGLHGGLRRAASHRERARVNVTRQIKSAIDAVRKVNPPLGRHLANSIYTGSSCRYAPSERIKWQL
jgi:tetratricopeptide (TPR) repeat protein